MSKLTQAARGQHCTIQVHPYCLGSSETVVFCHAPSEKKGMGIKSPDWWGADGCANCHNIVDGRMIPKDISADEIYQCFMRGVFRTIERRIRQALIKITGEPEF